MELVGVRQTELDTIFDLRNISGQTITAFSIKYGDTATTIDGFQTTTEHPPGEVYSLNIRRQDLVQSESLLEIAAVVFADGRALGYEKYISLIRGRRLGRLAEAERVKRIFDETRSEDLDDLGIGALVRSIGKLPESFTGAIKSLKEFRCDGVDLDAISAGDDMMQHGFLVGLSGAREEGIWRVNQMKQLPLRGEEGLLTRGAFLSEIRSVYESIHRKNRESVMRHEVN